jgi:hypothetical protein
MPNITFSAYRNLTCDQSMKNIAGSLQEAPRKPPYIFIIIGSLRNPLYL